MTTLTARLPLAPQIMRLNHSQRSIIQAAVLAVTITTALVAAQLVFTADPVNWLEVAAVGFSFACTWLCVKQVRFNYVLGVISTALLSVVFWQAGLLGSMALNLYLVPTLVYGWFAWGRDEETLPVQHVALRRLPVYVLVTAATYGGALWVITSLGGQMGALDGWLLIGSILAQYFLDRKKIETWLVWILVNVVSVYVYFSAGLYLLAAQFAVFLFNAIYAYYKWNVELKQRAVAGASSDEVLVDA